MTGLLINLEGRLFFGLRHFRRKKEKIWDNREIKSRKNRQSGRKFGGG